METLFIYIVKVNIALAVFYLLYMLLFRKDTFIRLRRYYFLSAIIFSLSYPLFSVSALGNMIDWKEEPVATETSVYIGEISMGEWIVDDVEETARPIDWAVVAKNILLVGTLFLSLRLLWQLFSIVRIKSRSEKRSLFGYLFYHLKDEITPFSFFNWIFVNSETHNEKELKQILLHEHTHARQWHSLDILSVEILRIAFWWNPIVWFMKRDIAINLEYLADEAVLQEGVETTEYQYHLLQLTNHETAVQIVNNFNVSQLKQRIIMMNTNKTPMRKLAKYLSILPLALLLIVANSMHIQANEVEVSSQEIAPPPPPPPQKKESKSNEVFVVVDKQPEFPGGTKELMKFLGSNIEYPKEAQEKRIEGRVILSFIVEKDGSVTDVEVVRGQDPLLDAEATRVITLMPKWTPGELKEETVRVKFNLPIVFRLPKTDSKGNIVARYQQYENKDQTEIMVIGSGSMDAKPIQSLAEKFGDGSPLIIVDDVKMEKGFELNSIMPTNIESITVLKDKSALEQYGKEGKDGAIIVTLKDRAKIQTTTDKEEIFVVVEDQPQFPGGTEALMQYLGDNINYPKEAHEKKIEGRVIVNFVINEDGSISEVSIVRGVDPLLDAEAIRVISAMPNWKPGMQRGQAVRVRYTLPISFNLQDGKDTKKETIDAPDDIFVVVEQQPEFPGGMEAMMTFLGDNIKYPAEAQKNRVQGRVIVNFVVNKDGSLSDMKVVRGQDPSLDAEAIRVIATMPNWKPGMQRGEAVNVRFTLPIVFRLKADKDVETDTLKDKESPTIVAMKNDASEKAFHEFIGKNARYPVIAQENGIMGFVKASYDVNSNGEVSNIKIVEGVDPALDKELTRIIEIMPKDIALIKSGGKAASNVEISAVFRLQNGDTPPPPPVKSDVVVVGYGKPAEGVGNKANKGIQKKPSIVSRRDQKTDRKFYEFISQRIKYPAIAQENSITGVVRASYDVDSNGEISNIKITKGADPLLDAELKRVIQLMPNDVALMRTKGKAASNVALSANFIFGDAKMHEVRSEESDLVVMGYRNPIE